jgi:hypothetical protein
LSATVDEEEAVVVRRRFSYLCFKRLKAAESVVVDGEAGSGVVVGEGVVVVTMSSSVVVFRRCLNRSASDLGFDVVVVVVVVVARVRILNRLSLVADSVEVVVSETLLSGVGDTAEETVELSAGASCCS